jgi:ribosomal protein L40E
MTDQLSNWEYLANHIPAIFYDGIMRMLKSGAGTAKPDACTLAALGLNQCVVSTKCSAALRPADASKCRGCASDKTCTEYWGIPNGRCDRQWSELSGWMCFKWVPGTQVGARKGAC